MPQAAPPMRDSCVPLACCTLAFVGTRRQILYGTYTAVDCAPDARTSSQAASPVRKSGHHPCCLSAIASTSQTQTGHQHTHGHVGIVLLTACDTQLTLTAVQGNHIQGYFLPVVQQDNSCIQIHLLPITDGAAERRRFGQPAACALG